MLKLICNHHVACKSTGWPHSNNMAAVTWNCLIIALRAVITQLGSCWYYTRCYLLLHFTHLVDKCSLFSSKLVYKMTGVQFGHYWKWSLGFESWEMIDIAKRRWRCIHSLSLHLKLRSDISAFTYAMITKLPYALILTIFKSELSLL